MKKTDSVSKNTTELTALSAIILMTVFFVLNYYFNIEVLYIIAIIFLIIGFQFGVRVIVGNVVPRFKHKINVESKWFKTKSFEEKLFKKLNVKKWKNKAPVYDPEEFDFEKNTKDQLIINMCNAEIVHEVNILSGYISLIFAIFLGYVWLFFIGAILGTGMDLIFVIIQRFNRPRMIRYLNRKNYVNGEKKFDTWTLGMFLKVYQAEIKF